MRENSSNNKRLIEERVRSDETLGAGVLETDSAYSNDEEAVRKEIVQERDKRIQQEIRCLLTHSPTHLLTHSLTVIRLLQAETFRMEREWRQRFEKEKHEIEDLRVREEKEFQRKQRQLTDEVSELAVTREQLYHELKEWQGKGVAVDEELRKVKHEVEVYESGINAHKLRVKDIVGMGKIKEREETQEVESKILDIKRKCERYSQLMKEKNDAAERYAVITHLLTYSLTYSLAYSLTYSLTHSLFHRELNAMDLAHQNELESLDVEVKSTLENKDEEIEYLRDSVHTEKVKATRLEKLLKQYSSRH